MASSSVKHAAAAAFALLFFTSAALADFSMRSLSVSINVNKDGSANVEERLAVAINGTQSRELYDATRSAYSDLATWKERTGLSEMRHHISRANAEISNIRVTPQAIERCNAFLGTCYSTVAIDYQVMASQNGSGLVRVERYKPRTAKYSLRQDALSFEQTKSGDLVLPAGTDIAIAIPQASEKIYFSTLPQSIGADEFRYDQSANLRYYIGGKRTFSWQGDALSKFQFTYEIESPLETEVIEFFQDMQRAITDFFFGPQGLAALFIIAAGAASAYYFNRVSSPQ